MIPLGCPLWRESVLLNDRHLLSPTEQNTLVNVLPVVLPLPEDSIDLRGEEPVNRGVFRGPGVGRIQRKGLTERGKGRTGRRRGVRREGLRSPAGRR